MATAVEAKGVGGGELDGNILPGNKDDASSLPQPISSLDPTNNGLESMNLRADPDAQATVTDYLDFTEYLPSDMMRSLTLIGKLDQSYHDASANVNELTSTWGKLPTLPTDQRPAPVELRKNISENLNRAVSSRVFSHAEAVRIHENVVRHYNRAKTIHAKLQAMRDNYPSAEEQKSPTQVKSTQMVRAPKVTLRLDSNGQKIQRPPRITVPGEVLAPYEMDFNAYGSSSDESSDEEEEEEEEEVEEEEEEIPVSPPRQVTMPSSRIKPIKIVKTPKQKIPKTPRPRASENAPPMMSTSTALAQLKPPPENAVPGSADAPWLQLTLYELAKLRKRMKKNAVWNPSDTMIARELKNLGRGVEAYKDAQKRAEEDGQPFEAALPAPVVDAESGAQHPPEGAISAEALTADEVQLSNRGMKLNEAKKLKRESMARIAAEEAEESARKMVEAARMFLSHEASPSVTGSVQDRAPEPSQNQAKATKPKSRKRKRNSMSETPVAERPEGSQSLPTNQGSSQPEKPQLKRTKTETPVPLPQLTRPSSVPPPHPTPTVPTETPVPVPHLGKITQIATTSKTPVPVPVPVSSDTSVVTTRSATSPSEITSPAPLSSVTTTVPVKPPAETPLPLPIKTSTTPIPPPTREGSKRETRQNLQLNTMVSTNPKQSSSRGNTPVTSAAAEPQQIPARRPTSRGKAPSQEPPATFAPDRPRRASTARNTPAPELRQPSKRAKRPAPGVVTTNSGGTSAIGTRKAAPRKKARGNPKKERGASQQAEQEVEVEVDDDGNIVDPDEPRYCLCNRVSFGTMIQCDNVDACKQEWFHLECVGLSEIPARTTKWYCPECRVLLNIGGRGEVTSRGIKM